MVIYLGHGGDDGLYYDGSTHVSTSMLEGVKRTRAQLFVADGCAALPVAVRYAEMHPGVVSVGKADNTACSDTRGRNLAGTLVVRFRDNGKVLASELVAAQNALDSNADDSWAAAGLLGWP